MGEINRYSLMSLKELMERYQYENDRENKYDREVTHELIRQELHRRVENTVVMLDNAKEEDVLRIYNQFIEH